MAVQGVGDKRPWIAESSFVSESASVVGDVWIGEHSAVFPGAVIRGDLGPIKIGDHALIEDNVTVHCDCDGLDIGNEVTVGHGAVVNCRRIGDGVLIGMNATILQGADLEDGCIVAAGAVVSEGTKVPEGSFVAGVPAKVAGRAADTGWQWKEWDPELRTWWWGILEQYKSDRL